MFFRICFKAIFYGKMKTVLLMMVCGVFVAISTSLVGLVYDIRLQIQEELKAFGPNFVIQSRWRIQDGQGISEQEWGGLKERMEGLSDSVLSPRLRGVMRVKGHFAVVEGLEFGEHQKLCGHWEIEGGWPKGHGEAMAGKEVARKLGFRLGDRFHFEDAPETVFLIRGIFKTGGAEDEQILLSLEDSRRLMGGKTAISSILARIKGSLEELEALSSKIEADFPSLKASPIRRVALSEGRVLDAVENLVIIVTLLIFAITALTVMATSTTLVSERREEFALARALGATARRLAGLFYTQAILSGVVASPIGFLLGFAVSSQLAHQLFSAEATFRWETVPVVLLAVVLVILFGGIIAVKRISRIEPAVVLKGE